MPDLVFFSFKIFENYLCCAYYLHKMTGRTVVQLVLQFKQMLFNYSHMRDVTGFFNEVDVMYQKQN